MIGIGTISVASDFIGLKTAALELMEEALMASERDRIEKLASMAANRDAILASYGGPERTMADGYYTRVGYLLDLESFISLGAGAQIELELTEARGILCIREARDKFRRMHPPCAGGCGRLLTNANERKCSDCQRLEFEAQSSRNR
jgi:hypothetical protein